MSVEDADLRRELTLKRAKAIVSAVTYYDDPKVIAEVSADLGDPMAGIDIRMLDEKQLMAPRGW
jgi:pyridoxal 5'-phosphate synthase pdxS subunit